MIADLYEIVRRRALIRFLARAQLQASVHRAVLGTLWFMILPMVQILIYYFLIVVIFGRGERYGVNPVVFIMAGIMHYTILGKSIGFTASSIYNSSNLLLQIKVEPLVLVAAGYFKALRLGIIGVVLFLILYLFLGPPLSLRLLAYPFIFVIWLMFCWIASVFAAAACVYARDLEKLLPMVIQIMMYMSPVIYSVEFFPAQYYQILVLNPITGIFSLFQWSLLGAPFPPAYALISLTVFLFSGLVLAHLFFAQCRRGFTKAF